MDIVGALGDGIAGALIAIVVIGGLGVIVFWLSLKV